MERKPGENAPILIVAAEYLGLWAMEKLRAFVDMIDDAEDWQDGSFE